MIYQIQNYACESLNDCYTTNVNILVQYMYLYNYVNFKTVFKYKE